MPDLITKAVKKGWPLLAILLTNGSTYSYMLNQVHIEATYANGVWESYKVYIGTCEQK